jgi:hypothetical protein
LISAPSRKGVAGQAQPQQQDDDAGQRAVGLVVAGKVLDGEVEGDAAEHPEHGRDQYADAGPRELRGVPVQRQPIDHRECEDGDEDVGGRETGDLRRGRDGECGGADPAPADSTGPRLMMSSPKRWRMAPIRVERPNTGEVVPDLVELEVAVPHLSPAVR